VGEGGVLDLRKLGCTEEISMRVRVGRNLVGFNLPGMMDKAERIRFEQQMLGSFAALIERFGGKVNSITPDFGAAGANPNKISDEEYNALVKAHVMFKDMDADPYLKSAGISSDWPYGRGCWQSADGKKIIWFGEEDQLRIMVMKKGYLINEVFDELKEARPQQPIPLPAPPHSSLGLSAVQTVTLLASAMCISVLLLNYLALATSRLARARPLCPGTYFILRSLARLADMTSSRRNMLCQLTMLPTSCALHVTCTSFCLQPSSSCLCSFWMLSSPLRA